MSLLHIPFANKTVEAAQIGHWLCSDLCLDEARVMKNTREVKTNYRDLATVVKDHISQGYELDSAHCNPENLKEIICMFSRKRKARRNSIAKKGV